MPVADFEQFPPALQQEFLRLRRNFEAGLPARWQEIHSASSHEKKVFALHRLAGAASSYGCNQIGALAREAEKWLKRADDGRLGPVMDRLAAAMNESVASSMEVSSASAETSQSSNKGEPVCVSNDTERNSAQGVIDGN